MKKYIVFTLTGIAFFLFVLFLAWGIQAAWLGSFPDTNSETYSKRINLRITLSVIFFLLFLLGIYMSIRSRR